MQWWYRLQEGTLYTTVYKQLFIEHLLYAGSELDLGEVAVLLQSQSLLPSGRDR